LKLDDLGTVTDQGTTFNLNLDIAINGHVFLVLLGNDGFLLHVMARSTTDHDKLVPGIGLEVSLGATRECAIEVIRRRAMPWCGIPGAGRQQVNGDFVGTGGLVDGQAEIVTETLGYRLGECSTTFDHLPGDELNISSIRMSTSALVEREDVTKIVFEEASVSEVSEARILFLGDLFADVDVVTAKLIEEGATEITCVCHVGNLL
jgi:hypothetical protein